MRFLLRKREGMSAKAHVYNHRTGKTFCGGEVKIADWQTYELQGHERAFAIFTAVPRMCEHCRYETGL